MSLEGLLHDSAGVDSLSGKGELALLETTGVEREAGMKSA